MNNITSTPNIINCGNCNPFLLFSRPVQLCEGPVFPTAIMLCNGTSVGTLTAYTSRCAKHNLEID